MHLVQITPPTSEPLALIDVKIHCNIDNTYWDSMLNTLITTARLWVEQYCDIALITQTWTVTYDYRDTAEGCLALKRKIRLPKSPVRVINSVKTYDKSNVETLLTTNNYFLSGDRFMLNDASWWPDNLRIFDSVSINFDAGFGSNAANVPAPIKLAILQLIAGWYEHRESLSDDILSNNNLQYLPIAYGVASLLSKYKVPILV